MTYAYSMDVDRPIEDYDRVSAEIDRRLGQPIPAGCLVHLITRTDTGFRVTEVWESQQAADAFGDQVMGPVIAQVLGAEVAAQGPPTAEVLEVHRVELGASRSPTG